MWTLIDEADLPLMLDGEGRWHAEESSDKKKLYVTRVGVARKKQRLHRTILGLSDKASFGDHKSGDTLNNRRTNLRPATVRQNARNRASHAGSTSRFLGVSWAASASKWMARIQLGDGKRTYLGVFDTEEAAAAAYDKAAVARDPVFMGRHG